MNDGKFYEPFDNSLNKIAQLGVVIILLVSHRIKSSILFATISKLFFATFHQYMYLHIEKVLFQYLLKTSMNTGTWCTIYKVPHSMLAKDTTDTEHNQRTNQNRGFLSGADQLEWHREIINNYIGY